MPRCCVLLVAMLVRGGVAGCYGVRGVETGCCCPALSLEMSAQATERQLADGLYYDKDDDLYIGGSAFMVKPPASETQPEALGLDADFVWFNAVFPWFRCCPCFLPSS